MVLTDRKKFILLSIGVFAYMFVFFTQVKPLFLYNTDDWAGFSGARYAIPSLKFFNPTRILPEIAMPICSYIAVYFVMPFQHDFVTSLMLVVAFLLCTIITFYVLSVAYYFHKTMKLSANQSIIVTLFFVIFHFLIFCSSQTSNNYLFYSNSVTNYFFYLMPSMVNMALLLIFNIRRSNNNCVSAIIILLVYLAICSNLFSSYILAAGVGINLIYNLANENGNISERIKKVFLRDLDYVLIIGLWLVTAIFEINGGRSNSIASNGMIQNIKETVGNLKSVLSTVNIYFIYFSIIFVIISMITLIITGLREKKNREFIGTNIKLFLLFLIYLSFIIMLCAKTYPSYISRPDVVFGPTVILIILICNCIGFLFSKYPKSIIMSILILFILLSFTNTSGRTFRDINDGVPASICYEIDSDIISQHLDADKRGETYIEIHVPKSGYEDNWPLALYGSNRIAHCLYKYGLISHEIEVQFIPDEELNRIYGIN